MKTLSLIAACLLSALPAFAQSPYDTAPSPSVTEQWPGVLHNNQSFTEALRERIRQEGERQRVQELEAENRRLKRERQRQEKEGPRERETRELLDFGGR